MISLAVVSEILDETNSSTAGGLMNFFVREANKVQFVTHWQIETEEAETKTASVLVSGP